MLRSVVTVNFAWSLAIAGLLGAAGCGKSTIREYEAQACSTNQSDDPFLVCSPAYDLVCITTHTVLVTNPKEAQKWDGGLRPVWVCRIACSADTDCIQGGDVCCPGMIYGKDYGKKAGCVPRGMCEALRNSMDAAAPPNPDGPPPAVDAPAPDAAGADARDGGAGADGAGADGGAGADATVDAGAAGDAPAGG
jgi:hypothetical protein